jgi:hypothetical protein
VVGLDKTECKALRFIWFTIKHQNDWREGKLIALSTQTYFRTRVQLGTSLAAARVSGVKTLTSSSHQWCNALARGVAAT